MSLLNKLAQLPEKTTRCMVCAWLETISQEERDAINTAIKDPNWTASALWRVLSGEGLTCGDSAFRKHVNEH